MEHYIFFERFSEYCHADYEACREQGKKIAGIYCVYAPLELIRAAGAIPVGLCGKKEAPIPVAEEVLPQNLCPLIKSSYGYARSDTCPFFAVSDFIIGETTCDGKKKMYEFLNRIKPVYLMHLPYTQNNSQALTFWEEEIKRLAEHLEKITDQKIHDHEVMRQIGLHDRLREEIWAVTRLIADPRTPLGSLEMMTILETKSFAVNLVSYIDHLTALRRELAEYQNLPLPDKTPLRVLLTGCPVGRGSEKVIRIIEELGASVVCMENCTGMKNLFASPVRHQDPLKILAERYLAIPCSCMTPNQGRLDSIRQLAGEFSIHAVIDLTWLFCHTYNVESKVIEEYVSQKLNFPCLHIVTDYSSSDCEQLRTRIEAFLEMIQTG